MKLYSSNNSTNNINNSKNNNNIHKNKINNKNSSYNDVYYAVRRHVCLNMSRGHLEEPVGLVAVVGVDVVKGLRRLHQQMVSPVRCGDVDRRELVVPREPTERHVKQLSGSDKAACILMHCNLAL